MNEIFFNAAKESAIETISQDLVKGDEGLEKEKPEAVLICGDTNT